MIRFHYPELLVVERNLAKAGIQVKLEAEQVTKDVIEKVAHTARGIVPRRTGQLAGSISSEVVVSGGYVRGEAGPTARHGLFVEWGTYKDAPQAFMGPALDRHSNEYIERLADEVTKDVL